MKKLSTPTSRRVAGRIDHVNPFTVSATARGKPHLVTIWDSPSCLAEYVLAGRGKHRTADKQLNGMGRDAWYGADAPDTMARKCTIGDSKLADEAAALARQVGAVKLTTPRRARVSGIVGRPCIPAYLAGSPLPMRRTVTEQSESAPLNVVVNITSSAGISNATLQRRGVVIAALCQALTASRPVNLYLCATLTYGGVSCFDMVKFPTTPLDLKRFVMLAAHQGIARGFSAASCARAEERYRALTNSDEGNNKWGGHNFAFDNFKYVSADAPDIRPGEKVEAGQRAADDLRAFFGGELFYIPAPVLGGKDHQAIERNALAWINDKLAEYGTSERAA